MGGKGLRELRGLGGYGGEGVHAHGHVLWVYSFTGATSVLFQGLGFRAAEFRVYWFRV